MSHGINIKPFPTIFWLCCPKLKNRISDLEASNYIKILQDKLKWNKSYQE